MRTPYYESTMHKQIREKRENRKERIKSDLELYGSEVLRSEEMSRAFEQTHHKWSTVGEHTFRVAFSSVMICYALRKLNIKDIIERHMWPAGQSKAPNSIEGAVVSVADKYNAVKDIIKGSEVNHTGVKNYVQDEREKIREGIKDLVK